MLGCKARPRPKRNSAALSLELLERRDLLSATRILPDIGLATTCATQTAELRYADPNESRAVSASGSDFATVTVAMPADASLADGVFVREESPGIEANASSIVTSVDQAVLEPAAGNLLSGLNIVINAGATLAANPSALDAFQRAGDLWEALFADPITVTINADLVNLGSSSIIGQASSVLLTATYGTTRDQLIADADSDDTIVASLPTSGQFTATLPFGFGLTGLLSGTKASLKASGVTGLDAQFGVTDATIEFNTLFAFDFDNSNGVTAGTMDFETVAAHEIGHALGFVSIVDTVDAYLEAGLTTNVTPRLLDLFRFANDVSGQDPSTSGQFTTYPRSMTTGGNPIFDDTVDEWHLSTGAYTGDGRQASHWKDNNLTGSLIGIMDPTLAYGQLVGISDADVRALDLIGWDYVVPANQPPVLDPIGNKLVDEGGLLSFTATASDPDLSDLLTYSLGPGAPAGASIHPTSGLFTWTPTDNFAVPQAVTIIVSDNGTPLMSDSETILITVQNVAPTAGVSGPVSGVRGEPLTYTLTAADASPVDQASGFTFAIDWDGDLVTDEVVFGPPGMLASHVFADSGNVNIRVTATDKDTATSVIFSQPMDVANWSLRPNSADPLLTDLVWGGSTGQDQWMFVGSAGSNVSIGDLVNGGPPTDVAGVTGDVVVYGQVGDDVLLTLNLNGATIDAGDGSDAVAIIDGAGGAYDLLGGAGNDALYVLDADGSTVTLDGGGDDDELYVTGGDNLDVTMLGGDGADGVLVVGGTNLSLDMQGQGGEDVLIIVDATTTSTTLDGGDDNDLVINGTANASTISGGNGMDFLNGGYGNDSIVGGSGNDVLVDFGGADSFAGGTGEDLILAGSLSEIYYGEEELPGLLQVWLQWAQPDPIATRVAYLDGTLTGGLIEPAYVFDPGTTILDDVDVDSVLGEGDADWLLYDFAEDSSDYSVGVDTRLDIG